MDFEQVLKEIKPTPEEKRFLMSLFEEIKARIKERFGREAMLMGSVAKDTFLRGEGDLDIFVFFDPNEGRETLEREGMEIGKFVFESFGERFIISYAEHPYVKGKIKGVDVEIVPAFKIKEGERIISAVDRTPFHTKYIKEKLKDEKMRDEVRLLKKFLKVIKCYGSDLKTQGFSGYLCELLIVKYRSFLGCITNAAKWRKGEIVVVEESSFDKEALEELKKEKKPLIVIDPVDPKRNVASALSLENFSNFVFASRVFLEKKSTDIFFLSEFIEKKIPVGRNVYAVCFERPDVVEDILYPQLRRLKKNVVNALKHNNFTVLDAWVFGDSEAGIGIEVEPCKLARKYPRKGPSIFSSKSRIEGFLKKYRNSRMWIRDEFIYAEAERKFRDVESLLHHIFSGESKEELSAKGIPKHLSEAVLKGYKVLKGKELKSVKSKEFWEKCNKNFVSKII